MPKTPQTPATPPEKPRQRHIRERVFISAKDWQRRLAAHERMNAKEREAFDHAKRLEISLEENRRQALALIVSRFGAGEGGWERCAAAGGCSVSTYKAWARIEDNIQPRAQSFLKTRVALGLGGSFFD